MPLSTGIVSSTAWADWMFPLRTSSVMCPSRSTIFRLLNCAISGLCVTNTIVLPSACRRWNSVRISNEVRVSRLPVASSAKIITGLLTSAREIATLKVLGFTSREVDAYIFRETILLSVIGAAIGLVLGVFMEGFVITTAEVDQVMFGRDIHAASFAIAFALTMVFSGIVALAMRGKLRRIDMVESLKSNE